MGVAGANYGYSLMWVLVLAIFMRFVLVSLIARYHLCNQHGESVIDGLCRLHPAWAPGLAITVVVMAHVYGAYMTVGVGEVCANLFRVGPPWLWATVCNAVALTLVFRPAYGPLELVFKLFLACSRSRSSARRWSSAQVRWTCCRVSIGSRCRTRPAASIRCSSAPR